jgi:hypothetical protein
MFEPVVGLTMEHASFVLHADERLPLWRVKPESAAQLVLIDPFPQAAVPSGIGYFRRNLMCQNLAGNPLR